jgi:hypothetical protein
LIKKQSISAFAWENPPQSLDFPRLQRFSTAHAKLPPNSVGASVDKVFASLCGPRHPWATGDCSKIDQLALQRVLLDKSRFFFTIEQRIMPFIHSCPHLLWVVVWITCSPNPASHGAHSPKRN